MKGEAWRRVWLPPCHLQLLIIARGIDINVSRGLAINSGWNLFSNSLLKVRQSCIIPVSRCEERRPAPPCGHPPPLHPPPCNTGHLVRGAGMGGLSFRHSYNSISHPAAPGRSRYKPSLISPLSVCLVDTSVAQHRGHNGNVRPVLVAQHSALCHVSANLFRLFILLYELPARVLCSLLTADCQL